MSHRRGSSSRGFVTPRGWSETSRGAAIPPPESLTSTARKIPSQNNVFSSPNSNLERAAATAAAAAAAAALKLDPFAPPTSYSQRGGGGGYSGRSEGGFQHPTPGVSKHGYSTITSISEQNLSYSQYGVSVKRQRTEEEYFNDDEEEDNERKAKAAAAAAEEAMPYLPAPGSPGPPEQKTVQEEEEEEDSEEDPLDAFMADLEKTAKQKGMQKSKSAAVDQQQKSSSSKFSKVENKAKGIRDDIDGEDDEESYYKWLEENPNAGRSLEDIEDDVEYDADGNPIVRNSKYIDPLPPIDHNLVKYAAFEKNFYNEHPDILGLSNIQVIDLQQKLGVHVSGAVPPKPVTSFAHFGFDETLMKSIRKSEFTQPTPIQSMGIPAILSGRDVIGIAKTGSGKTAAFLWPMLMHIVDQPRLLKGQGPIGLVLAPTRELAMQIYAEAKKYAKLFEFEVVCAYGGGSKWEQSKAFEKGAEIAVATPGRMIDMIKMKVTNLERVTYLVLDEADRMFDMGFEPQVRSICDHVRPDRQCSLFSATFKRRIERLARDVLTDPIKIVQGSVGEASEDVTQIVKVVELGGFKWSWLTSHLVEFTSAGSVLIFVTKKQNCEELGHNLTLKEIDCRCIHGDLSQHERNEIIHAFKKKEFNILVATDVAARGLDIPHIRTVVNFDVARDIDTHTHRVGRTGRAGVKGTAYTLVTEKDKEFAGHIVRNLEAANQEVPKELMDLAMKSSWFKNSRFKKGRGKGMMDRAGLGMGTSSFSGSNNSNNPNMIPLGGGGGGTTDRLSTKKMVFKNSYLSNFRKATEEEGVGGVGGVTASKQEQLMPPPPPTMLPPPPPPPAPSAGGSSGGGERKKRSRWE